MNEQVTMVLYVMMAVIIATVLISGLVLLFINWRKKRQKMFSAEIAGVDTSDYADMLSEKLRNERFNEE